MSQTSSPLILPDWVAPGTVGAFVTTRASGPAGGRFNAFNTADHVGDDPVAVAQARQELSARIGDRRPLLWLDQVHGAGVQQHYQTPPPRADASVACDQRYACVVQSADCLPVLFCDRRGTRVAAAHAGWRGLAGGVLEATVAALGCPADEVLVWLGPAISNRQYEVGGEVFEAFVSAQPAAAAAFEASPYRLGHFMCDLYRLARLRLEALGITRISGGHFCTASDARFYSFRRDNGDTGRMASVIWLRQG